MGRNIGSLDQTIRIGIGTAMVMMWIFGPLGWWGILGFLPLITGITGACPIYPLFGISTWRSPTPPEPTPPAA
ncbi:YgaP family membrane protein [Falsiroseomonas sp. HW251]|uniref:YgaP family membrane protein n=1 Tax=Falsiroseomonas sp. HW251 TaxID=3390998 RepID=UPI003D3174CE